VRFKEFLAFPMYAAAAWLVWVLSQQTGSDGVIAALGGAVLLALAIWLWRAGSGATSKALGRGMAVLSLVAALALAGWQTGVTPDPSANRVAEKTLYQPYTKATLDAALQKGDGVFVNFTAAWCITCLVNERVALSNPSVIDTMRKKNVVYLKGDWTNQDPEITAMLEKFGRSGVPLYLYYPPGGGSGEPVILPQILTPSEVEKVLNG